MGLNITEGQREILANIKANRIKSAGQEVVAKPYKDYVVRVKTDEQARMAIKELLIRFPIKYEDYLKLRYEAMISDGVARVEQALKTGVRFPSVSSVQRFLNISSHDNASLIVRKVNNRAKNQQ